MIHYALPSREATRNRERFSARDIALPTSKANVAEITLSGRYPEAGFALNSESEMLVRILKGATVFHCEGEEVELPMGSTVLVETNKKYYWNPQEQVTLYVVSTPPWTVEQHRSIPE